MTLFSDLHRALNIPPDYHIERDKSPNPPPVNAYVRKVAIDRLHAAGEIDGTGWEDLASAICAKLNRLPWKPKVMLPRNTRKMKSARVIDAIMADPTGSAKDIAARVGRDPDTIRRYIKQLREEGKV